MLIQTQIHLNMKKNIYHLSFICLLVFLIAYGCKKKDPNAGFTAANSSKNNLWDASFSDGNKSLDGPVNAIATSGSVVFVGGDFTKAGGGAVNHIAIWDTVTKTWRGIGGGVNGTVRAIVIDNEMVYVAGSFTTAGTISANNIARWDTINKVWAAMGSGVSGTINSITVSGGSKLYVGGSFTTTAGLPPITLNNIAKYDTTSHIWSSMASGINGTVSSVLASGSGTFVGGYFITAGDVGANNIADWFGASWTGLGTGVTGGTTMALANGPNGTYIGGNFNIAGGKQAKYIALWNGSDLEPLGSNDLSGDDYSSCIRAITINNNEVFVGGIITAAGGVLANNIAKWDGAGWVTLGTGVQGGSIRAMATNGNDVFVGGDFTSVGDKSCTNFSRWKIVH
jgi:hypothetical protein